MSSEMFFKHPLLPYLECRRSTGSRRQYRPHMHRTFSVGAIDRGTVEYRNEDEYGLLKPGELILMNPDTLHFCNPAGDGERNYYVLYADTEWCRSLQRSLWAVDRFIPAGAHTLRDAALFSEFIAAMETLLGENDALLKEQTAIGFMERLFLAARAEEPLRDEPRIDSERVKALLASELSDDLALREIAERCGMNPFTLIRQFKASAGITPHAYRMNCRIEHAKELLRSGFDLSRIALDCGFYDQSHFSHIFKSMTAVTPKEYAVNFLQ